jgi:hypothetical protein
MKRQNILFYSLGIVVISGTIFSYNFNSSPSRQINRSLAQQSTSSIAEIRRYYIDNVNQNGNVYASAEEMAKAIIQDHTSSKVATGGLVFVNILGPSDSDFKDKTLIERLSKQEVIELAIKMNAKANGGTIALAAGNTNTGVGRVISAIQDPEFQKDLLRRYNVRITTWGLSSSQAALNHGEGKYGTDFMNTKLNGSTQIPTADGDWTVKRNGISQEVSLNLSIAEEVKNSRISYSENIFMVKEGGPIAIEETTQMLLELLRLSQERGASVKDVVKIILQQGHQSGLSINEVAADKGTRGVSDLLTSLYVTAKNNPDFKSLLESLNVEYQHLSKDGIITFKGDLDFKNLEKSYAEIFNSEEGRKLLEQAKVYRTKVIVEGANLGIIDAELGILNGQGADQKTLNDLKKELKALAKDETKKQEYNEQMQRLLKHQKAVRIKSFANSYITFLQAVTDVAQAYGNRTGLDKDSRARFEKISYDLKRLVAQSSRLAKLEINGGKIVRSTESEAARLVREAAKK